MITYSRKFQTECKKLKISEQERALADLITAGWTAMDAFIALGHYNPTLSDAYNKDQLHQILVNHEFREYTDSRKRSMQRAINIKMREAATEGVITDEEEVKLLSKEEVLQQAVRSAMELPVTDPKRIDILMKYADLAQLKKEQTSEEDTTIHYYLPLSCNNCSLYIANKTKSGG